MASQNIPPATLTLTAPAPTAQSIRTVEPGTIGFGNAFNYFDLPTPMFLQAQEGTIFRTPAVLIATLDLALAGATATFRVDGVFATTGVVGGDGSCGPITLELPEMSRGWHTYSATVNGVTVFREFYVQRDPRNPLLPPVPDADPEVVPEAVVGSVQRWVLQDLMPGGLGSWVMPANPKTMTPIPRTYSVEVRHSTSVDSGQFHLMEAEPAPLPWSFSGYCPDQEFYNRLDSYGQINRRFYLIDHRNRAWTVTFDDVELTPRHRQKLQDGSYNDWAHDYTVRAVIYDQSYKTPVVPV